MDDYHHFYQLIHLDLNNNNINNLIPIKVFKNLKMLNLQNNKISNEASTDDDLIELNPCRKILLKGNDNNSVSVGIFGF